MFKQHNVNVDIYNKDADFLTCYKIARQNSMIWQPLPVFISPLVDVPCGSLLLC